MKDIVIKQMRFLNFKGLRDYVITFPSRNCNISGDNGLGKSTIFDGFMWVLFDKNSKDRTDFNIKTLDANNKIIQRLPHEVEITLSVNGEEVKLLRRFNERWVKQRGALVEQFSGNMSERLYNDVPCTEDEWKAKIADICPEQVFKFITNPLHFATQPIKVQRDMLLRMIGGVNDAEIAAGNASFANLLAMLTGKTLAEYSKEVAAKKARVKKELDKNTNWLEERRRDVVDAEDWKVLEEEITAKKQRRTEIEQQITDTAEQQKALGNQRSEVMREIQSAKEALLAREFDITQQCTADYRKTQAERQEMRQERNNLTSRINRQKTERDNIKAEIAKCAARRETLMAEYISLNNAAAQIVDELNNGQPQMSDSDFRCPTCGAQYDFDRIEEIQEAALKSYREKLQKQLAENAEAIDENKRKGRANNERKEALIVNLNDLETKIAAELERWNNIDALLKENEPQEPDATPLINADAEVIRLRKVIEEKTAAYNALIADSKTPFTSALYIERDELNNAIEALTKRLAVRDEIQRNNQRIAELEAAVKTYAQELSKLEKEEFVILEFSKARIEAVESKINQLFTMVKFKLFHTQVNGAEVETCQAMVNGIPFSDLNDAGRINAGLDIINAICKFEGITAPIFIDNAESINSPIDTKSQRIRLIVSHEPKLTVTEAAAID